MTAPTLIKPKPRGRLARMIDSDVFYSFRRSPLVILAAIVTVLMVGVGVSRLVDRAVSIPMISSRCR